MSGKFDANESVFFRPPAKAENKKNTQEGFEYIEERVGNLQKSGLKVSEWTLS